MKKVMFAVTIVLTIVIGVSIGAFLYYQIFDKEELPAVKTEETLEPMDDVEDRQITELNIINHKNLSEEEVQACREDVEALCEKAFSLAFNIGPETKDYTKELRAMYGTDEEVFGDGNADIIENLYKEFKYKNFQSEYIGFEPVQMTIWNSDVPADVSIIGLVNVHAKMDGLEEGDYSFPVKVITVDVGKGYQLHNLDVDDMCKTEGLTASHMANSGEMKIAFKGTKVFSWYLGNYEVFVNEGVVDTEIDPDDYDMINGVPQK